MPYIAPPGFIVDPASQQFVADNSSPGGSASPVLFPNLYDYTGSAIVGGQPPAASGLSYTAGVFTALVPGTWSVLVWESGLAVAHDATFTVALSGPYARYSDATFDKPAASTAVLTMSTVVSLVTGDTWELDLSANGSEVPSSEITLVVDRLA
jgi:hypothetical protein